MNALSFDIRIIFLAHKLWPHSLPKRKSDQPVPLSPISFQFFSIRAHSMGCYLYVKETFPTIFNPDTSSIVNLIL